jgi:hypothetical protein
MGTGRRWKNAIVLGRAAGRDMAVLVVRERPFSVASPGSLIQSFRARVRVNH